MSEIASEEVVSVSSRRQVTIPKVFREALGSDTPVA